MHLVSDQFGFPRVIFRKPSRICFLFFKTVNIKRNGHSRHKLLLLKSVIPIQLRRLVTKNWTLPTKSRTGWLHHEVEPVRPNQLSSHLS